MHCHRISRDHSEELPIRERLNCDIVVAVAGQPNVGKSTLFNVITGELARVANWPGVTVERKEGVKEFKGKKICFVDLPGIYGISASSLEEIIAREYIISGEPDLILVLVDSTTPERTLYLPIQILELTPKVIIALTKIDQAHSLGIHIHIDKLEAKLGVPVVATSAIKGIGIRELLEKIVKYSTHKRYRRSPLKINYGGLEPFIAEIMNIIRKCKTFKNYPLRWVAIRLLEGDPRIEELIEKSGELIILREVQKIRESVKRSIGKDPLELIISSRFNFVDSISSEVIVRLEHEVKRKVVEKFEELLSKPFIGSALGLTVLTLTFIIVFTINLGFPLNIILNSLGMEEIAMFIEEVNISGLISEFFDIIANLTRNLLKDISPHWLVSLIADGVIPGVGAVFSFFPLILLVFLFLAMLEDSGIAPRLAVSFHNIFNKFGFSGKVIYPIIVSLGCNVPGVMTNRTAVEEEERYEIILSTPFIPCQARLIIVLAFITAFFVTPVTQSLVIVSVYLVGLLVFLISGALIRRLLFRKKEMPELIIEVPPIHKPNLKVVWWITWDYSKHFLKKAGVVIFTLSIVTWFLLSYGPNGLVNDVAESYGAYIGRMISPLLTPYELNYETSWKIGYALINGFIAKEGLVESVVLLFGGDLSVKEALNALGLTVTQAYAILIFMMLYVPCLATVAVIYQESKSIKLTILSVLYMVTVAYIISILIYYVLKLLT